MSMDPSPEAAPSGSDCTAWPEAEPPGSPGQQQDQAQASQPQASDSPLSQGNGQAMGTLLEPVLRNACHDRLSEVSWFRTDWQRGGAVTGYAIYTDDAGREHPVVVKLPVPPVERRWLVALQTDDASPVVPRVYQHGEALNGYDLAWVVMERLSHGPLGTSWGPQAFDLLADAAARFYAAAGRVPVQGTSEDLDWADVLQRSRQFVRQKQLPEAQRWNAALKKAQKKLKGWLTRWQARPCEHWCHGDLHLGNAMTRDPDGPAVLLDLARTRPGHWVEDAVYFEHLYWGREHHLDGRKPCKLIAQQRKAQGLAVEPDWAELAQLKRTLLAISAPLRHVAEADATHMRGALGVLERAVGS